eukprot:g445.t1
MPPRAPAPRGPRGDDSGQYLPAPMLLGVVLVFLLSVCFSGCGGGLGGMGSIPSFRPPLQYSIWLSIRTQVVHSGPTIPPAAGDDFLAKVAAEVAAKFGSGSRNTFPYSSATAGGQDTATAGVTDGPPARILLLPQPVTAAGFGRHLFELRISAEQALKNMLASSVGSVVGGLQSNVASLKRRNSGGRGGTGPGGGEAESSVASLLEIKFKEIAVGGETDESSFSVGLEIAEVVFAQRELEADLRRRLEMDSEDSSSGGSSGATSGGNYNGRGGSSTRTEVALLGDGPGVPLARKQQARDFLRKEHGARLLGGWRYFLDKVELWESGSGEWKLVEEVPLITDQLGGR